MKHVGIHVPTIAVFGNGKLVTNTLWQFAAPRQTIGRTARARQTGVTNTHAIHIMLYFILLIFKLLT